MTATLPHLDATLDAPALSRPRRISRSLAAGAAALPELEHNVAAKLNVRAHALRAVARVAALVTLDVGAAQAMRTVARVIRGCTEEGCAVAARLGFVFPHGYLAQTRFAVALVAGLVITGAYGGGDRRRDSHRILLAAALATVLPLWAELWADPMTVVLQIALGTSLLGLALLAARRSLDAVLYRYAPGPVARTLLVGRATDCEQIWSSEVASGRSGFSLVGSCPTDGPAAIRADDVRRQLADARADTMLLCGQLDDPTFEGVVRAAMMAECRVLATARRLDMAGVTPTVVWRRGRPFVEMRAVALRWQQLLLKRVLDVVGAATLLVVLAPLMALVAVLVSLGSAGPVVYGQSRLGRYGQRFRCYKFRSMYPDAEQRLAADPALHSEYLRNGFKLPDGGDPRITPVGRVLRRTSLDELPQLWNVLRGDMSLVGPRPIVPDEIRHYDQDGQMLLLLKPGITGLWQVSGRSDMVYPERSSLELEYVERWTLGRDLRILLKTVPVVLAQRGAH